MAEDFKNNIFLGDFSQGPKFDETKLNTRLIMKEGTAEKAKIAERKSIDAAWTIGKNILGGRAGKENESVGLIVGKEGKGFRAPADTIDKFNHRYMIDDSSKLKDVLKDENGQEIIDTAGENTGWTMGSDDVLALRGIPNEQGPKGN